MRRTAKPAERLDHHAVPAGDVAHQHLEHGERALAAAIEDGAHHVGAPSAPVEGVHQARADQVADIGQCPVVAEFRELVFPEPVDAAPGIGGCVSGDLNQAAQDLGIDRVAVFVAIDLHPLPEPRRSSVEGVPGRCRGLASRW